MYSNSIVKHAQVVFVKTSSKKHGITRCFQIFKQPYYLATVDG